MSLLSPSRPMSAAAALCAAALLGGLVAAPAAAAAESPRVAETRVKEKSQAPADVRPSGRFIVKFKEKAGRSSVGRGEAYGHTAKELGTSVKEVRGTATGARVITTSETLDAAATREFVAELEANPDVEYVEPDLLLRPMAVAPNDDRYKLQWDFWEERAGLRVPGAWEVSRGEGIVVAVVDTGITSHSDLNANVLPGYDMISGEEISRDGDGRDPNPLDEGDWAGASECDPTMGDAGSSWHGTHVAGTIAAVTGNGKGVAGVAPEAKILPVRAMGACGGYLSDITDGMIWAAGGTVADAPANPHPAKVINLSLGGGGACSPTSQEAIDYAHNAGAAVVVAAGNESTNVQFASPANCRNVIAVAASDRTGAQASYSNYGTGVDVSAPGGDITNAAANGIYSTLNAGTTVPGAESYGYSQGTSMAAPHVAGVAALLMAEPGKTMTPAKVEQRLKETARPLPRGCSQGCGAGLVDATAALNFDAAKPSITSEGDIVAFDSKGRLWNYGHAGNGTNRKPIGSSGWTTMDEIHTVDWNADGFIDIIAQAKTGRLYYYQAKPDGGFIRRTIGSSGWARYDLTVSKWRSGDKYPALIAKNRSTGRLYVYPNQSGKGLSPRYVLGRSGWSNYTLTAIDWDRDGRKDVVAKTPAGQLKLYRGNGSGKFISETRPVVGRSGWNSMRNIVSANGYAGKGTAGLIARDSRGKLWYYQANKSSWAPRGLIGTGWSSYHVAGQ